MSQCHYAHWAGGLFLVTAFIRAFQVSGCEVGDLEKVVDALAEIRTDGHCPNIRLIGFQRFGRLSHPSLLFGIISFDVMVLDPILGKQRHIPVELE